jgi:alpha-galactosidase
MEWDCAGINHLAWFTTLKHKGVDLYQSKLYEKFEREVQAGLREAEQGKARYDDADVKQPDRPEINYEQEDLVRKDMCLHFGAFITESSGHLSEYLPYYRKSEEGRKLLRLGYHGGSRFYASNWPNWRKQQDAEREQMVAGEKPVDMKRSWEYASWMIEAREKNVPHAIWGNVMNHVAGDDWSRGEAGKLITNLPGDGCVEVKCIVDGKGVQPVRYGALPPQMASICASNMAMFDRAADACIHKSKEAAIHALLLDPLTQAVCTPRQIKAMAIEMFEAQADYLPDFK